MRVRSRIAACLLISVSTSCAKPRQTGVVDSHVHLSYYPVALHGLSAVVDLAAPERTLSATPPLRMLRSGPMLTHPNGYPLDAWGSDGYGIGCSDAACVTLVIDRLISEGAGVIKVALDEDGLDPTLLPVVVERAHAKHKKVAAHALTDAGVRVAAAAGVDVLAHTPIEPLTDPAAWKGRAVITTLAAFGGSASAIDNLRRLHEAGAIVLYGTDLGNLRVDGPSADEQALMKQSGLTDAEITAAMTTVPWHYWGFDAP